MKVSLFTLLFFSFSTSKLKMSKPLRTKDNIGRIQDFKMMIWLVTYYEFFLAKVENYMASVEFIARNNIKGI